jgi:hypothetical protein
VGIAVFIPVYLCLLGLRECTRGQTERTDVAVVDTVVNFMSPSISVASPSENILECND